MKENTYKLYIIDEATTQAKELNVCSGSFSPMLERVFNEPISVSNSYKFECSFKDSSMASGIKDLVDNIPGYKTAKRLADELNDLIEEYHAPGTPRSERRTIKREFDKVFRIFRKHCYSYNIDFGFERLQN